MLARAKTKSELLRKYFIGHGPRIEILSTNARVSEKQSILIKPPPHSIYLSSMLATITPGLALGNDSVGAITIHSC